jgi:hypothetical protein
MEISSFTQRLSEYLMLATIPDHLDPPASVLFLGSGFTHDATNIRGDNVPTGAHLRTLLADLVGVSPSAYDLKVLAEELASQPNSPLRQLLYDLFTIKELSADQIDILKHPWLRIYTTNYDDAAEFAHHLTFGKYSAYNYDDPKPARLLPNSIIHLQGSIRQLTEDNVLEQLVLTERSYVRQHFEQSPWYDEFVRDLRFASACFFVGYSLSDHHIASLLLQSPTITSKTYFIRQTAPDSIFQHRVSSYGEILSIGVNGFAELCRTLPRPAPLADPYRLKSFRYVDPRKDKKTLAPPTAIEVLNLLAFGTFNYARSLSAQSDGDYVVARNANLDDAVRIIDQNRCLLIHSRLGNGKSIFIFLLATRLAELGYTCLLYRGEGPAVQQELALVRGLRKVVILLDSYTQSQDATSYLAEACPEAKFVVTVRTGVHDVRLHEIDRDLPKPFGRLNLNRLTQRDIQDFTSLCQKAGVGAASIERIGNTNREMRDLLIVLFQSQQIQQKVEEAFGGIFQDTRMKRVLLAVFLVHWIGENAEPAFLRAVTGADAFVEMSRVKEVAGEILRLEDDELQIRSAVFAHYVVQRLASPVDLVDSIYNLVVSAAQRKNERKYRVIMSGLMQFARLRELVRHYTDREQFMQDLYERLRYHVTVNDEPLFWLQYAILMIEMANLQAADEFLTTAYARAAAKPGFRTYQIDTQACRLLLLREARDVSSPTVQRFEELIGRIELVVRMVGEESHRYYAIKVLEEVAPFVHARLAALSVGEANVLVFWLAKIGEALERLSPEVRAETASDRILAEVVRARQQVVGTSRS